MTASLSEPGLTSDQVGEIVTHLLLGAYAVAAGDGVRAVSGRLTDAELASAVAFLVREHYEEQIDHYDDDERAERIGEMNRFGVRSFELEVVDHQRPEQTLYSTRSQDVLVRMQEAQRALSSRVKNGK